jgi:hypothetical protein
VRLDDQVTGQAHELQAISLKLPLISSLPADAELPAEPSWAFTLHGAPVTGTGKVWPFATQHANLVQLAFDGLKLAPFSAYWPTDLPLRPVQGQLSAQLNLTFKLAPRGSTPDLKLQGEVSLLNLSLASADASTPLKLKTLKLGLRDVQPLAQRIGLGQLQIGGAELVVHRDAKGQFSWASSPTEPSKAVKPPNTQQSAKPGWQIQLDKFELHQSQINWRDDAQRSPVDLQLVDIELTADSVRWPAGQQAPVHVSASLRQARRTGPSGQLLVEGQASLASAKVNAQITDVNLSTIAPYLTAVLTPKVSGLVSARAELTWAEGGDEAGLNVDAGQVTIDDLRFAPQAPSAADQAGHVRKLSIQQIKLATAKHQLSLGEILVDQPGLSLRRDANGLLNIQQWLVNQPVSAPTSNHPAGPDWQFRLGLLTLRDGRVQWTDERVRDIRSGKPVRLDIQTLDMSAGSLTWPVGPASPPLPTQISARIASSYANSATSPAGLVRWAGKMALRPMQADGRLQLRQVPLHRLMPYVPTATPFRLARADASFDGKVHVDLKDQGVQAQTTGDLRFTEVRLLAPAPTDATADSGEELLSWQSLALQGLRLNAAPGQRPRVEIQTVTLDDFFARMLINETGRFNLNTAPVHDPAAVPDATATPAPETQTTTSTAIPLDLLIGSTLLRNGRVDFTDHFVQPHYSAQLTELQGQVGRLDSNAKEMASIGLRGRAAGTGLLDIQGQINPMTNPPALDIKAQASELELAPLSPYAIRYAGYGIDRGKLTANLAYKVDQSGQLQASNQIVLNQLTFGDKVDSPTATSLPVRLAVSLLKDRNGVIDINLPVSGSLQDPQFSVGGIVFKLIVNLVGKALTAPFALLSGGGDHDLSLVEFEPGTAQITAKGRTALQRVATALADRPGLTMTVSGVADPAREREQLAKALLEDRLRTEQRRLRMHASGTSATPVDVNASAVAQTMSPDERALLLQQVYRQTPLPDKPRNLIGMVRELPAAEAEQRLLAASRITEDAMRQLALQRGLAVRDALTAHGLATDRLFIAAPKLRAAGEDEADWTPRVELSLADR